MSRAADQQDPDRAQGSAVRCFVGAFLEAGDARRLSGEARRQFGDAGRLLPAPNYHVTLKFLGDVARQDLPAVLDRVAQLEGIPMEVSLPALAGFPGPERCRMVVAEVADDGTLARWHAALNEALWREDRAFRPHVTLVRFRRPRGVARRTLDPPLTVSLGAPQLYRSDRDRTGARYRPVTREDVVTP